VKTAIEWLKLIGALILLIAIGEIPVVHQFSDWINVNRSSLLPFTLSSTLVGFLVMVWGWIVTGIKYGRPMSDEEAGQFMSQPIAGPGKQSFSRGRFKGIARGREVDQPVEWSFREMKEAWHSGTWRRDPDMRRKYFITAGGLLLVLSGLAVFIVLMKPPSVKLLMAGTVVYATVRTTIGFWRA